MARSVKFLFWLILECLNSILFWPERLTLVYIDSKNMSRFLRWDLPRQPLNGILFAKSIRLRMWKGLSSSVLSVPRVIHACTILLGIFISATRLLKRVTHGNWPRALWFIYLLLLTFPSTNVINSCLDGKDKQTQLSQKICSFACLYIERRFTIL